VSETPVCISLVHPSPLPVIQIGNYIYYLLWHYKELSVFPTEPINIFRTVLRTKCNCFAHRILTYQLLNGGAICFACSRNFRCSTYLLLCMPLSSGRPIDLCLPSSFPKGYIVEQCFVSGPSSPEGRAVTRAEALRNVNFIMIIPREM
jgi:hypothetical protein